jgi:hypothetical protein
MGGVATAVFRINGRTRLIFILLNAAMKSIGLRINGLVKSTDAFAGLRV